MASGYGYSYGGGYSKRNVDDIIYNSSSDRRQKAATPCQYQPSPQMYAQSQQQVYQQAYNQYQQQPQQNQTYPQQAYSQVQQPQSQQQLQVYRQSSSSQPQPHQTSTKTQQTQAEVIATRYGVPQQPSVVCQQSRSTSATTNPHVYSTGGAIAAAAYQASGNTLDYMNNISSGVSAVTKPATDAIADANYSTSAFSSTYNTGANNSSSQIHYEHEDTYQQNSADRSATYLSEMEQAILRASVPIQLNETEEVNVNGERGIWVNKSEVSNWRGNIPINRYGINQDNSPEVVNKKTQQQIQYIQEMAVRYLKPPTPPPPGEIIITQEPNTIVKPAPPIIMRQQPPRPVTPEPLIIREAPPQPPHQVGRKVITISGKSIPPAPRKVVIERLAPLPSKPQSVLVERWLPYSQAKRRVIFQRSKQQEAVMIKPKNVIIQWEAPKVSIKREIKNLGIVRANPADYVSRYGSTLKNAKELPQFVRQIRPPYGVVLAADQEQYNNVHELEGDVDALKYVDLEREGLSQYRKQIQQWQNRATERSILVDSINANANLSHSFHSISNANQQSFDSNTQYSQPQETLQPQHQQEVNYQCSQEQEHEEYITKTRRRKSEVIGTVYLDESESTTRSTSGDVNNLANPSMKPINYIIEEVFSSVDKYHTGYLSVKDAERVLIKLNNHLGRRYGGDDIRQFFAVLELSNDGNVSLTEFKRAFNSFSL